jgi:ABC-type nitrate/sulfonate/bicarbonate transport system substrate-binding protein
MIGKSCRWVVLAAAITALGVTPAYAVEQIRVAVAARVIFAIPYWIAVQKGYFREEGIEPRLDITETAQSVAQLRSGALDFTLGGPDGVLADATKGGPLRIIAGIVPRPPLWLITRPSIKTFADLRGANVGVLSPTEGSSKLLVKMAKAEGLAPDDLKITRVGGAPTRHTLLKEGKIDAGMQPLPLNYEAEEAGFNNLGWAGKYEPKWQFITVNAHADWARSNSQTTTGFVRALLRGQQLIAANPREAAQIAADELKTSLPLAERSLAEAVRLGILDPKLDWSEAGLQRVFENMQADGAIPPNEKFALGKVVVADYLQAAQKSMAARSK